MTVPYGISIGHNRGHSSEGRRERTFGGYSEGPRPGTAQCASPYIGCLPRDDPRKGGIRNCALGGILSGDAMGWRFEGATKNPFMSSSTRFSGGTQSMELARKTT